MSTPVAAGLSLAVLALIVAVVLVDSLAIAGVALVTGIVLLRMGGGTTDEPAAHDADAPADPPRGPRAGRRRTRRG